MSDPLFKIKNLEFTTRNQVQLLRGGRDYFDMLINLLNQAKHSIHLQTYIFADDNTGSQVAEALKKAAVRGVQVHVLLDGFASKNLPRRFINELRQTGIQLRFFEPLLQSKHFYLGRRLHHKVIVVDTFHALVGGLNIADRYNDLPGQPAWLDFAFLLKGESARQLCVLCWKTWNGFPLKMDLTPCETDAGPNPVPITEDCLVSIRRNDWVRSKNQISSLYVNMFRNAKSSITILCSYFLPGRMLRNQLLQAIKRGVKIKVITAGISDIPIAKHAERYTYKWLLQHNVELYEYKPTVLHGKIAICDSERLTVGSYNINDLSTYASIELNVEVKDKIQATRAQHMLDQIIDHDCFAISREVHRGSNTLVNRFLHWASYEFLQVGFKLATFYYRHKP